MVSISAGSPLTPASLSLSRDRSFSASLRPSSSPPAALPHHVQHHEAIRRRRILESKRVYLVDQRCLEAFLYTPNQLNMSLPVVSMRHRVAPRRRRRPRTAGTSPPRSPQVAETDPTPSRKAVYSAVETPSFRISENSGKTSCLRHGRDYVTNLRGQVASLKLLVAKQQDTIYRTEEANKALRAHLATFPGVLSFKEAPHSRRTDKEAQLSELQRDNEELRDTLSRLSGDTVACRSASLPAISPASPEHLVLLLDTYIAEESVDLDDQDGSCRLLHLELLRENCWTSDGEQEDEDSTPLR